jgi:formylglycine-generating enzyme required for sulfatase activity
MGSPEDESGRDPSEQRHRVRIGRPFYMQTTELTLGQWRALMGKKMLFGRKGDDRMPVTRVSWFDAQAFIEKLNARGEGTYRLPTEAEWEYASRAGTTTAYSWGDTIDCEKAMYANSPMKFDQCVDLHRAQGLPVNEPAPVKSYGPNPWGLYDMHGNVWEWCQDWYGPYPQGSQIDPKGPESGVNRIRRGGSWFGLGPICRSANRAYGHPAQRLRTTGFRLVREVEH